MVTLGGPHWSIKLRRRDSRTASQAGANTSLSSPFSSLSSPITSFSYQGLSAKGMVALSGAHIIGQAKLSSFRTHIYNDTDIDASFATLRKGNCPAVQGNGDSQPSTRGMMLDLISGKFSSPQNNGIFDIADQWWSDRRRVDKKLNQGSVLIEIRQSWEGGDLAGFDDEQRTSIRLPKLMLFHTSEKEGQSKVSGHYLWEDWWHNIQKGTNDQVNLYLKKNSMEGFKKPDTAKPKNKDPGIT